MRQEIKIFNLGFVCLDNAMATDLSVVNSARVSFNKRHARMKNGDDKLIQFLMKNKHGTPFEHGAMRWRIKAPIFVFREWHRHRIGHSYNEWSARYSELKPHFYIPTASNVRKQVGKPGKYTYEKAEKEVAQRFRQRLREQSKADFKLYKQALKEGIAKEQARLFLPFNIYSEMYWTVNPRSLMHFLSLRNAPAAMQEIRTYAKVIEDVWSQLMPITHAAFLANNRVAP